MNLAHFDYHGLVENTVNQANFLLDVSTAMTSKSEHHELIARPLINSRINLVDI